ncbi:MAG: phosphoribosylanthranilate isomerase [Pseudomonadota bacterium]
MWVKICGLTTAESVADAIDAGADAVGFVFAESVRAVSIEQAILLAGIARGHAEVIAVMKHPSAALAAEVQARVQPDRVQTDTADFETLRLLPGILGTPVYRDSSAIDANNLPPRFLYEGDVSGSGTVANWQRARSLASAGELILAGGLSPANVGGAIEAVQPFGVDVSSGVEAAPGVKDAALIREFVRVAKAADTAY